MIAIINYGMGNLPNVKRALEKFTKDVIITSNIDEIISAEKIVLPGVGAFGDAMRNIDKLGLRNVIVEEAKKKPLLGVCLGMQLLFESSEEDLSENGLGIIKGKVVRFKDLPSGMKIPEMGWNSLKKPVPTKILNGIEDGEYFYFVHSYYVVPEEDIAAGVTNYGVDFVCALEKGNVMATQFHPEKSHNAGLAILENFVKL